MFFLWCSWITFNWCCNWMQHFFRFGDVIGVEQLWCLSINLQSNKVIVFGQVSQLKMPSLASPHPTGAFIWKPFNRHEHSVSLACNDNDFCCQMSNSQPLNLPRRSNQLKVSLSSTSSTDMDPTNPPIVVPLLSQLMASALLLALVLIRICFNSYLTLTFIMKIIPMCTEFCRSISHNVLGLQITWLLAISPSVQIFPQCGNSKPNISLDLWPSSCLQSSHQINRPPQQQTSNHSLMMLLGLNFFPKAMDWGLQQWSYM